MVNTAALQRTMEAIENGHYHDQAGWNDCFAGITVQLSDEWEIHPGHDGVARHRQTGALDHIGQVADELLGLDGRVVLYAAFNSREYLRYAVDEYCAGREPLSRYDWRVQVNRQAVAPAESETDDLDLATFDDIPPLQVPLVTMRAAESTLVGV